MDQLIKEALDIMGPRPHTCNSDCQTSDVLGDDGDIIVKADHRVSDPLSDHERHAEAVTGYVCRKTHETFPVPCISCLTYVQSAFSE